MKNPYLGKKYNNNAVQNLLENNLNKIEYKNVNNFDDLNNIISKKLIEENIIGWFQDRMEFGSRALGNRSIIATL